MSYRNAYSAVTKLTKRELFAAMAMQGLLANPCVVASNPTTGWGYVNCDERGIACAAADQADALLAELAKDQS